ncbi:hypothetical protein BE11_04420 [Sorangium cellulosum]|nr:hypothetical protein BE11_04420 [Sorangium cellulosum]
MRGAREHAASAIRTIVSDPDALKLLAAIKARESLHLGLWFRVSSVLAGLGPSAMRILLAADVASGTSRCVDDPPMDALRSGNVHRASCARVT